MGRYEAKDGTIIPSAKVRAYLYAIVCAASPLAIIYGIVNQEQAGAWLVFGGAILGITNGIALANTGNTK